MKPHAHIEHPESETDWRETPQIYYTQWIESIRAAVAESVAGVVLSGARPIPIASDRAITGGIGVLVGYSLRNLDPANAAVVRIYDASESEGVQSFTTLIATLAIPAGESAEASWSPGPGYTTGLYVVVSGTTDGVEGSVWVRG